MCTRGLDSEEESELISDVQSDSGVSVGSVVAIGHESERVSIQAVVAADELERKDGSAPSSVIVIDIVIEIVIDIVIEEDHS